jgi:cadherin EGF LAG seven-pass G-type receptor 1
MATATQRSTNVKGKHRPTRTLRLSPLIAFTLFLITLASHLPTFTAYQVYVPIERNYAGSALFQAQPASHQFRWSLHTSHNHRMASKWLRVRPTDGLLTLQAELQCAGGQLWTIVERPLRVTLVGDKVALDSDSADGLQQLRLPVHVWFDHHTCRPLFESISTTNQSDEQQLMAERLHRLSRFPDDAWPLHRLHNIDNTAVPNDKLAQLLRPLPRQRAVIRRSHSAGCLQKTQLVAAVHELIPAAVLRLCRAHYHLLPTDRLQPEADQLHFQGQPAAPSAPSFAIQANGQIVTTDRSCPAPDHFSVTVLVKLDCDWTESTENGERRLPAVQTLSSLQQLRIDFEQNLFWSAETLQAIQAESTGSNLLIDTNQLRLKRELQSQRSNGLYFDRNLYIVSVPEEQDAGQLVTVLSATSALQPSANIRYAMHAMLDARSQQLFRIDEHTGHVYSAARLDREQMDVHYFKVTATLPSATSGSAVSAQITLQVNVQDVNDHGPVFEQRVYEHQLSESQPAGTSLGTLRASDADVGVNAELEYSVERAGGCELLHESIGAPRPGNDSSESAATSESACRQDGDVFHVQPRTGELSTRSALDRERCACYALLIRATDQAPVDLRKFGSAWVRIKVIDENDHYPQFERRSYSVRVREDLDANARPVIAQVIASDADDQLNALLRYSIVAGNHQAQFTINSANGELQLVKALDYETERSYQLIVRAQDTGSPPKSNTTQLLVSVLDVNDHSPLFFSGLVQETVSEDLSIGARIVRLQAFDADDGPNGRVFYAIRRPGERSTAIQFKRYNQLARQLHANDTDSLPVDESSSNVFGPVDISELKAEGNGSSTTSGDEFPFEVESDSGWLVLSRSLDFERQTAYEFQVIARDFGRPFRESALTVRVRVQDVNDNRPQFAQQTYQATVSELTRVGSELLRVRAADADDGSRLAFAILSGNQDGRFALLQRAGANEALLTLQAPLDFRRSRQYDLRLQVSDAGGLFDTCAVTVNVTDANTHRPVIRRLLPAASPLQLSEDLQPGALVAVVEASDADSGENARLSYSLLAGASIQPVTGTSGADTPMQSLPVSIEQLPFRIHGSSGEITLAAALDRETAAGYSFVVQVRDHGQPPLSDTLSVDVELIDVNDNAPQFERSLYSASLSELAPIGTAVLSVKATDHDQGANAQVRYQLVDVNGDLPPEVKTSNSSAFDFRFGDLNAYFTVDPLSGLIRTARPLDRETIAAYRLIVSATDRGQPSLSSTTVAVLTLEDANDNPPRFSVERFVFYVAENSPTGSSVGIIKAEDADSGKFSFLIYFQ